MMYQNFAYLLFILLFIFCASAHGDEPICKFPDVQAWDSAVRVCDPKHDGRALHVECRGPDTINSFSAFIINDTILVYGCVEEIRYKTQHKGIYQVYHGPVELREDEQYAYVICGESVPKYLIKPSKPGRARNGVSNKDKQNVFVIMMDAISWEGVQKYMPTTLETVRKASSHFDVTEFVQYSAVGSNSYPNKFRLFGEETYVEEAQRKKGDMPFNYTWIWEKAKDLGYFTVYSESYCPDPLIQTQKDFNIEIFGQRASSSGYHENPDVVLIEQMCGEDSTLKGMCIEHRWAHEYVVEHMSELFQDFSAIPIDERAPIFLYNNFADPHTDNQWGTAVSDENIARYLKSLMQSPLMENGMIVFLSDHGLHYGSYQSTSLFGLAENRHPFLFTITNKGHSKMAHKNANKLVSPMDIHHLFLETIGLPKTGRFETYNPLTERIPASRTCQDAGIPWDYCLCMYKDKAPNPSLRLKCNYTVPEYLWWKCETYSDPAVFDWKYYYDNVLAPAANRNGGRIEENECFSTIHWCSFGLSCPLQGRDGWYAEDYLCSLPDEKSAYYCYNWPETFNCHWGWLVVDYLDSLSKKKS